MEWFRFCEGKQGEVAEAGGWAGQSRLVWELYLLFKGLDLCCQPHI